MIIVKCNICGYSTHYSNDECKGYLKDGMLYAKLKCAYCDNILDGEVNNIEFNPNEVLIEMYKENV